ncbi:MAG: hypothetical protein KDJ52_36610, partial [Anaerolineae bacterium]|nr:hypothetical protein [Anaerolineae bacterium]
QGQPTDKALYALRNKSGKYNLHLLTTLEKVYGNDEIGKIRQITVNDLTVGMVAGQDICSVSNLLLVSKGQEITKMVIVHLQNIAARVGVQEPFWVSAK